MNERELIAYLAGLFDAEGSIMIEKKKPQYSNKSTRYGVVVSIVNTRQELVQVAHERYGGSVVGPVYQQKENQKPFYMWRLSGVSACNFLREIEPYLIVKRDRLPLIYELQDRIENYHHKPLEDEELQAREEIYQRFRRLNRRGVSTDDKEDDTD